MTERKRLLLRLDPAVHDAVALGGGRAAERQRPDRVPAAPRPRRGRPAAYGRRQSTPAIDPANEQRGGRSTAVASGPVVVTGAPGLLAAGTITYHGGAILRTTDADAVPLPTWAAIAAPVGELTGPSLLATGGSPAQHALFAVYTLVGISDLVRSDNGAAAVSLGGHLPLRTASQPVQVEALTVNPTQPRWPYLALATPPQAPGAIQQRGLFASPDGGLSWLPLPLG